MGSRDGDLAPFEKLGRFVFKHRKVVVVAWIIALVGLIPVISQVGNATSLQQGSASGNQLESVKAADIVARQFARTVPNSTLLLVISADNVSSPATQAFVRNLALQLKSNSSITGLNQSVDAFSQLYSVIYDVNRGGLSLSASGNQTAHTLLGIPALYLRAWNASISANHTEGEANAVAFAAVNSTLPGGNRSAIPAFLLAKFNESWSDSESQQTSNLTVRASWAYRQTGEAFIAAYMQGNSGFGTAVLGYFPIARFMDQGGVITPGELSSFASSYLVNTTGFSQKFVRSAVSLGALGTNDTLYALAGNVVWNPASYELDHRLGSVVSSFISPQKDTTLISLGFDRSSDRNLLVVRGISHLLASNGQGSGVHSVLVTGQDAINYDFGKSTQADLDLILPVTIALLIAATGLFFRSVLTPFITLGTIAVALGISQVFVVLVSSYIAKVDFTIPTILLTVLIGVGTDYSVFVIARYREERVKGLSVQEAVVTSVTWAGESITTSGATVIISFLALALTSVVFLRTMGFVVGLGVMVALLVALTLVPAIVGLVGGKTFWPNSGVRFDAYAKRVQARLVGGKGYFSRSGVFAVKHAKVLIVLAVVVSIPAVYVYSTTTPTYDFLSAAPSSLESVSASNHLNDAFGGGRLFPTYVVLTFERPLVVGNAVDGQELGVVEGVSSYLATHSDIRNVTGPSRPYGVALDTGMNFSDPKNLAVLQSLLQSVGLDNQTALITVNLGIDPYSTQAISDAQDIRGQLHESYPIASSTSQPTSLTGLYVGGASGAILDTKNVFDAQFNSVVPLVAVGVALVLLAVLGSLFLPVFAVFSVLMSIIWTLAATKLVFQAYFDYQILFITPFFLFVTLLGLGMDYNVFILTRVREEAKKGNDLDSAIVRAIEQTGGIITAAAIILAGSLGALMLSSDLLLKQMGFAFAFSILIDALIVRTYLVPAVMSTVGRWNWFNPIPLLDRSRDLFEKGKRAD